MIPSPQRLYHPTGPDRTAMLSVEPSSSGGAYLIRYAYGKWPLLKKGSVFGPYSEAEVEAKFAELLVNVRSQGFVPAGLGDLLQRLQGQDEGKRARAALGLGWRKMREAVEPILAALANGGSESCSYLDALGDIGDPRAIPVCREQATRKLLSRRRSAVEALRKFNDVEGMVTVRQATMERLPESIRSLVDVAELEPTLETLESVKLEQRGLALDSLYELDSPGPNFLVWHALAHWPIDRPHLWRYAKSIGKRAMLRRDFSTLGILTHRIEELSRANPGSQESVKSGLDGQQRLTVIFSRKTQQFMKRLSWRYLRQIATHEPTKYSAAAADAILQYTPEDATVPQGMYGQFANCYLLHRVLWGKSSRFISNDRSLRFRFREAFDANPPKNPATREESYPELWDREPRAYLRLLAFAKLPEVHDFANKAVEQRHPTLLQQATGAELVKMLDAPFAATIDKSLLELERRFDPAKPDWALLSFLLQSNHGMARTLGERWLRLTADRWTRDVPSAMRFLTSSHPSTRTLAAELVTVALKAYSANRSEYAEAVLACVREAKLKSEHATGILAIARGPLLTDLSRLVSLTELLAWIEKRSLTFLPLYGDLLGSRSESLNEIGVDRAVGFAMDEFSTIRHGAFRLLERGQDQFRPDRTPLLTLAECRWADARAFAVKLLRTNVERESMGLDAIVGFLDSEHTELQDFGKDLAKERLSFLPADKLALMLSEHPHRNMREFAWNLIFEHLPQSPEALAQVEPFFRVALFDLKPQRKLKNRVLAFLDQRANHDPSQATVAVRILKDVVRVQGRTDFENALETLVRVRMQYPDVVSPVTITERTS